MQEIDYPSFRVEALEETGDREELLLDVINTIEVPLLSAIKAEFWDERQWRVCGATTIALAWLLNGYTGIPFTRGDLNEHLEIQVDLCKSRSLDHAYLLYHTGKGAIMPIDATGGLLWRNQRRLEGAIDLTCSSSMELRTSLVDLFDLHRYTIELADELGINIFKGDCSPNEPDDYANLLTSMHSPEALSDSVRLPGGVVWDVSHFWGQRICRPIRSVVAACTPRLGPPDDDWPVSCYILQ